MTVMAGATIAPSLPGMQRYFQSTPGAELWVQMVLTIPGLMVAISAPFMGWLLDVGKKRLILVGALALYGVSGMAGYWLNDLAGLFVSRLILGVAVAAIMVGCTTLIADYYPGAERGRYMGLMAAFGAFGGVIFMSMASVLVEWGWRIPFLIYAVGFVLCPLCLLLITEPAHNNIIERQIGALEEQKPRFLPLYYLLGFVEVFLLYSVPVFIPFSTQRFVTSELVVLSQAAAAGFSIALMMLVLAVVATQYTRLRKVLSYTQLHSLGLALVCGGFLGVAAAPSWVALSFALMVLGAGFGMVRPNLTMWLFSVIPANIRGRAMGGLTAAFFIAQFVCPIILKPVVSSLDFSGLFVVLGAIAFITSVAITIFGDQMVSSASSSNSTVLPRSVN